MLDMVPCDHDKSIETIGCDDGWQMVNTPDKNELLSRAVDHGLENDAPTRTFIDFVNLSTNFASLDHAERLKKLPALIESIKNLHAKIREEIKGLSQLENLFKSLKQSFNKLFFDTKSQLDKALSHLEKAVFHMSIMVDVMSGDIEKKLDSRDLEDLDFALGQMAAGCENLFACAESTREASSGLTTGIKSLKEKVETKIVNKQKQIDFATYAPVTVGAPTGAAVLGGATIAATVVDCGAFGAAGTLVLGGLAFPPAGAIVLGLTVGAFCVAGLTLLISKILEVGRSKVLDSLKELRSKIEELNQTNTAFFKEMRNSREEANKIKGKIKFIRQNVKLGSPRYLSASSNILLEAISATKEIINSIYRIKKIDLSEWTENDEILPAAVLDRSLTH